MARIETEVFEVYSVGFVCASVCTTLSIEEATRRLNIEHSTGVGPWHLSADPTFASGSPNPSPCDRGGESKHFLFNC